MILLVNAFLQVHLFHVDGSNVQCVCATVVGWATWATTHDRLRCVVMLRTPSVLNLMKPYITIAKRSTGEEKEKFMRNI